MDPAAIDRALILSTTRLFNRPGEPPPASPLTVVGGLSLFQRTILTLQRGGISRFIVLAGDEMEDLKRQFQADERIRAEMRWLPVLEFSPGDPRTWEIFPGLFGGSYLVVGTGAIFPASLVARVRQEARNSEPIVVVRDAVLRRAPRPGSGQAQHERLAEGASRATPVTLSMSKGERGSVVTLETAASPVLDVELVAIPEGFTASGWATAQDSPYPMHAALER